LNSPIIAFNEVAVVDEVTAPVEALYEEGSILL
jgi:hypothetical protein